MASIERSSFENVSKEKLCFFLIKSMHVAVNLSATCQWFGGRGYDAANFERHANFRCRTDLETFELALRC